MQINLDQNEIYYTGDLNKQEFEVLLNWLKKNDTDWESTYVEDVQVLNGCDSLKYSNKSWWWESNEKQTRNAKELFYTLENIQVDCRELSEEQIKQMADVFEKNGYFVNYGSLHCIEDACFLHNDRTDCSVYFQDKDKTTITYDKFMELFAEFEVNKNGWYKDGNFFMYHNFETDEKYGFCHDNNWVNGHLKASNGHLGNCKLATKEEVEERLKQEAIKRGFVKGVEVGCLNFGEYISKIEDEDYYLDENCGEVFWNTFCVDSSTIMKDGVWLESKLPPYKEAPLKWTYETLVGDNLVVKAHEKLEEMLREEISRQPTQEEIDSIFSSREKELKKTLKYLLKKDIILTPKQYKKLYYENTYKTK